MFDPVKTYPLPGFHFEADMGFARMGFTRISGLEVATSVIEYREGNSVRYNTLKQPGRTVYGNIVLQRGVFAWDFDFYFWWQNTYFFQERSATFRRDVTIKLLDESHNPIVTWLVHNAWPCRVVWGELDAVKTKYCSKKWKLHMKGFKS